eukprot:1195372-Prorocentrum_minimum.AAC.4
MGRLKDIWTHHRLGPERSPHLLVQRVQCEHARLLVAGGGARADTLLQRLAVGAVELALRAKEPGHQKVKERPQLQHVVLRGGALTTTINSPPQGGQWGECIKQRFQNQQEGKGGRGPPEEGCH